MDRTHRVPLGRRGWAVWRDVAVRGAGFPARQVLAICDGELAAAADQAGRVGCERYQRAYAEATERLAAAIRDIASGSRFREAVTWQNLAMVADCLDRLIAGERRNKRGRGHELAVASYLQRYCVKNDTIGFFGPVGWAQLTTDDVGILAEPGPELLARRTTYVEMWAVETLAAVIGARPEVLPWLIPRVPPSVVLVAGELRLATQPPVTVSPVELQLLERCDGNRTVRDLTGDPADPDLLSALLRLRELGAVRIDLQGPISASPERDLAQRIGQIADPAVREPALAELSELVAGRDAVAAAAGNAEPLATAIGELAATFQRLTGTPASRRPGAMYAGRTLLYEDTVRDVEIRLGHRLRDVLAVPLGLLLDSAAWLVNTVADRYRERFLPLVDPRQAVPLLPLVMTVMPEFFLPEVRLRVETVNEVIAEFQRRWRRVLDPPQDVPRYQVSAAEIASAVAREFPAGPPRWSGARHHSPDLLVAADGPAAAARGDLQVVLGELHLAINTLESRGFVIQHPEPARLLAAAEGDHSDRRVCVVPPRGWPLVTSRGTPPTALPTSRSTYLCLGAETLEPPAPARVVPVADLVVERRSDELVVRRDAGGGEPLDFIETIGDLLSALVSNAFRPFADAPHRPRVTVDRLVISRESWTFPAAGAGWAFIRDEADRYPAARRWRDRQRMPERVFVVTPEKPVFVDFRSLVLVNLFAKLVRHAAAAGSAQPATVTVSETLPDLDQLWLPDADGNRYTSELRLVAFDGRSGTT